MGRQRRAERRALQPVARHRRIRRRGPIAREIRPGLPPDRPLPRPPPLPPRLAAAARAGGAAGDGGAGAVADYGGFGGVAGLVAGGGGDVRNRQAEPSSPRPSSPGLPPA
ncbi:MAG: hypothetical protein E6J34_20300 [Chloroflexi bacterium]|nr:MAG: hypothetical protein E6J34_20300 [Chloroflexota bacterium]